MLFEMIVLCPKLPTAGLDLFMFNTPFTLSSFLLLLFISWGPTWGLIEFAFIIWSEWLLFFSLLK
jgi:hypothetical protein